MRNSLLALSRVCEAERYEHQNCTGRCVARDPIHAPGASEGRAVPPVQHCVLCEVGLGRNKGDASMLNQLHRLIFIPLGRDLESAPRGRFSLAAADTSSICRVAD